MYTAPVGNDGAERRRGVVNNDGNPRYDRRAASRVLAGLAQPGLFATPIAVLPARTIEYTCAALRS
jgi:hypothetical protein